MTMRGLLLMFLMSHLVIVRKNKDLVCENHPVDS